jgi:S1-C subfamily serine protease
MNVEQGSPAEQGEVREGDVIVGFAGQPVAGVDDLHRLLDAERVGVRQPLMVLRRGERLDLGVVPAESER